MTLPQVNSVSPNNGDVTGGEAVTVTGHYFTGATAVAFGAVAAAGFTVVSDTSITAIAPAVPGFVTGLVDITVTTPAGTSAIAGGDHFTYTAPTLSEVLSATTAVGAQVATNTSQLLALQASVAGLSSTSSSVVTLFNSTETFTASGDSGSIDISGIDQLWLSSYMAIVAGVGVWTIANPIGGLNFPIYIDQQDAAGNWHVIGHLLGGVEQENPTTGDGGLFSALSLGVGMSQSVPQNEPFGLGISVMLASVCRVRWQVPNPGDSYPATIGLLGK